jgi:hypothetical protein
MKTYLIGRSTATVFDFSARPPAPVFEQPLPTDGLLYFVSQNLRPAEMRLSGDSVVLPEDAVKEVAGTLKKKVKRLQSGLQLRHLRNAVVQELNQQHLEELEDRAQDPAAYALHDRIVNAITSRDKAPAGSRYETRFDAALRMEVENIMAAPIRQFSRSNPYLDTLVQRGDKNLDGYSTEDFNVDTGLQYNDDLCTLVPRLMFDIYLARATNSELVTNSTTRRDFKDAEALLDRIEQGDLAGYLAFRPASRDKKAA